MATSILNGVKKLRQTGQSLISFAMSNARGVGILLDSEFRNGEVWGPSTGCRPSSTKGGGRGGSRAVAPSSENIGEQTYLLVPPKILRRPCTGPLG